MIVENPTGFIRDPFFRQVPNRCMDPVSAQQHYVPRRARDDSGVLCRYGDIFVNLSRVDTSGDKNTTPQSTALEVAAQILESLEEHGSKS